MREVGGAVGGADTAVHASSVNLALPAGSRSDFYQTEFERISHGHCQKRAPPTHGGDAARRVLHFSTMAKKNRAALAQLDEALHAVGDCDQAVWTLKKSIGECRSRLGGGSFASTAAEARQIARALAMCAKSIDAAVAAAVAESVAAAEKAPGGATPVAWGAGKGRKEFGGAGSNVGAVGASTPAARTRPASAPLDMDSPAAARLVAAARETVTVHLVRPRKPPNTSENNNNNLKPPVAAPPKPVPFQFQRRVRDEVEPAVGIGAFAQLLPAMQEKLGMATHVVEVVGADGCVRRSDAEFVDGEFIFIVIWAIALTTCYFYRRSLHNLRRRRLTQSSKGHSWPRWRNSRSTHSCVVHVPWRRGREQGGAGATGDGVRANVTSRRQPHSNLVGKFFFISVWAIPLTSCFIYSVSKQSRVS